MDSMWVVMMLARPAAMLAGSTGSRSTAGDAVPGYLAPSRSFSAWSSGGSVPIISSGTGSAWRITMARHALVSAP